MTSECERLATMARRAVQLQDWAQVGVCARGILAQDADSAEGHFLAGLVAKAARRPRAAEAAFHRTLELDATRYDAAVELANQYSIKRRNGAAAELLNRYAPMLNSSPRYLDLAATVYTDIGLAEVAWPLYRRANDLQPGVPLLEANLAACSVYVGRIEEAKALYRGLLGRTPNHQRNHYHLARLERARDATHVEQMLRVLKTTRLPPQKNIFLYYALGKELEDLERWDEAFHYYKLAGDAASSAAHYDVTEDIALIDRIIEACDERWLTSGPAGDPVDTEGRTPIFIVGLPRTGTTLTERILASHSQVESLGETLFLQMVLRQASGVASEESMTPAMIAAAAGADPRRIARGYIEAVRYRLGPKPLFIEKLPFNFLYLGFIAKAFPHAHIIHQLRNPMDSCFATYKQVFTWAYKFSYSLESLGRYYVAYERLARHWRELLGARLIEVDYEALVAEQEGRTRALLQRLGLEFEPACMAFDQNRAASATASSVQVREKIHDRSVRRWQRFERHLLPLRRILEDAGIAVE